MRKLTDSSDENGLWNGIEEMFGSELPVIASAGPMLFDPVWALKEHRDGRSEMVHVIRGMLELRMAGESYRAGPGETLFVPAGIPHTDVFDIDDELEVFLCAFAWGPSGDYFKLVDNHMMLSITEVCRAEIKRNFDEMRGDLKSSGAADRLVISARVQTILMLALRDVCLRKSRGESGHRNDLHRVKREQLMRKARLYIEENYYNGITLDMIAATLNVSPFYLSHVFSSESQFTLSAYLTKVRMENARALLKTGELTVAEVAGEVGFDSPNYFSKVFNKHCGCSPSEYMARALKDNPGN